MCNGGKQFAIAMPRTHNYPRKKGDTTLRILLVLLLASLSGVSQATLIDRGAGMIYDDVLDITWLSDANPSGSVVNWFEASTWVDSLVYGGFDDWRLASMDVNMDLDIVGCDVISETDCQDNELGYMFYYNLMGSLGDNLTGDQGLFTNIQSIYWSSTAALDPPDPGTWVIFFNGAISSAPTRFSLSPRGQCARAMSWPCQNPECCRCWD